jgi:adenine-specific DNA glycosylase
VKLRKAEPVRIEGELLVVRKRGKVLLRKNPTGARLGDLWDLPSAADLPQARPGTVIGEFRHTITHHRYRWSVREASLSARPALKESFQWFEPHQFAAIPLTASARKVLKIAGIL